MDSKMMHYLAMSLLWIGGLNWGLVGLFDLDLVTAIFGNSSITQLVYILVGIAAVYSFVTHKETCAACNDITVKKGRGRKK